MNIGTFVGHSQDCNCPDCQQRQEAAREKMALGEPMTKMTPEKVEELEEEARVAAFMNDDRAGETTFIEARCSTILTLCREWREQQQVLADCDNAMTDYIVTLEKQGGMMGYGRSVLKRVRALIPSPITEAP